MMLPDIAGIINSWIAGKHFYKKSSEDLAGAVEELKDFVRTELERSMGSLLKSASPEQRATVMSTVETTTSAIIDTYMSTMKEPFSMKATVETSVAPKIIDPSTEEPEDMGPGRTGG